MNHFVLECRELHAGKPGCSYSLICWLQTAKQPGEFRTAAVLCNQKQDVLRHRAGKGVKQGAWKRHLSLKTKIEDFK